jgi:hypothetical protein
MGTTLTDLHCHQKHSHLRNGKGPTAFLLFDWSDFSNLEIGTREAVILLFLVLSLGGLATGRPIKSLFRTY